MNTLVADDLTFDVRLSAARRTLGITVGRMGELVLSCPPGVPEAQLRDFVMRKRPWVYKQLARKDLPGQNLPPAPDRWPASPSQADRGALRDAQGLRP
jgi:predicted metal-dependent hydrolase